MKKSSQRLRGPSQSNAVVHEGSYALCNCFTRGTRCSSLGNSSYRNSVYYASLCPLSFVDRLKKSSKVNLSGSQNASKNVAAAAEKTE